MLENTNRCIIGFNCESNVKHLPGHLPGVATPVLVEARRRVWRLKPFQVRLSDSLTTTCIILFAGDAERTTVQGTFKGRHALLLDVTKTY